MEYYNSDRKDDSFSSDDESEIDNNLFKNTIHGGDVVEDSDFTENESDEEDLISEDENSYNESDSDSDYSSDDDNSDEKAIKEKDRADDSMQPKVLMITKKIKKKNKNFYIGKHDFSNRKEDIIAITSQYNYRAPKDIERKTYKVVEKKKRKTSDFLTRFEYAEIISSRAKQISDGGKCFIETNLVNSIDIAKEELRQGKCPLNVERTIGDKIKEIWSVNELSYIKI